MDNAPDLAPDDDSGLDRHWSVSYNIGLGIRYHMMRQQFFGKWHRITAALSLAFSTSAVATLANDAKIGAIFAGIVAVLQALDLVIETRKNSELHNELRQEYIRLESEMFIHSDSLTKEEYASFMSKLKAIELKEPPIMYTLLELCRYDVNNVHNLENNNKMNFFKKLTANFIREI